MSDLTSFTPVDAMPDSEPWNTIKSLQAEWSLNQRWLGALLNCLFTERRHVFLMGRNMFYDLLATIFPQQGGIGGGKFKDFKNWLLENKIIQCLREPNEMGGPRRPGLYVIVETDLLGHMANEIGKVAMAALVEDAESAYDTKDWELSDTETDTETVKCPPKCPPKVSTQSVHPSLSYPIHSNPIVEKKEENLLPTDLVARMRIGLPFKKTFEVRDEALGRFVEAFKAAGFGKDDWTSSLTEEIRQVLMPPTKPAKLSKEKYDDWVLRVESEIETCRAKALGAELPPVPERDVLMEQVSDFFEEYKSKWMK